MTTQIIINAVLFFGTLLCGYVFTRLFTFKVRTIKEYRLAKDANDEPTYFGQVRKVILITYPWTYAKYQPYSYNNEERQLYGQDLQEVEKQLNRLKNKEKESIITPVTQTDVIISCLESEL